MHTHLRRIVTSALLATASLPACAFADDYAVGQGGAFSPLPPVAGPSTDTFDQGTTLGRQPAQNSPAVAPAADPQSLVTPERLQHGYTIVVVGMNGDTFLNAGLAPGLAEGGFPGAIEVLDWTTGHWPLFLYHLRAEKRHQTYARVIVDKIVWYQTQYPGRPVNLVGYSAGAVVVVEALEALTEDRQVDRVVLLAGAISPLHDLRIALRRTRGGIVNYFQVQDVFALWAGTTLAGTADGTHLPAAGAIRFWTRPGFSEEDKQLYRDKLVQLAYKPQMAMTGNLGGHFQCVGRKFVATWIAPQLSGHVNAALPSATGIR